MVVCPYGYFCFFFSVVYNLRCLSSSQPQSNWNMVTFLTVVFIFEISLILQSFLISPKVFINFKGYSSSLVTNHQKQQHHPQSIPFRCGANKSSAAEIVLRSKMPLFRSEMPQFSIISPKWNNYPEKGQNALKCALNHFLNFTQILAIVQTAQIAP